MGFAILASLLFSLPTWAENPVQLTEYYPPQESKGGWRTLLPEQGPPDAAQKAKIREVAGVDWDKLATAWEFNSSAEGDTALLVIRRGYIVGEWYRGYKPGQEVLTKSTTKSYISTAFGLLLEDSAQGKLAGGRKLTLDTKVCNPEWLPESLPLSDSRKADITLRHLLFATSGIPPEGLKIDDKVKLAGGYLELSLGQVEGSPWAKLDGEPGSVFHYSSPGVIHLILLFNNAAGKDLYPFLKERVFEPIGIEHLRWSNRLQSRDGKIGPYCSYGGVHTTVRDHARFCYLSMHRGQWAGRQIVPTSYYDFAFQGTKANPSYGAQWWLAGRHPGAPADLVETHGHLYNDGFAVPSLDLVFVRFGNGERHPVRFERTLVEKVLAAVDR
jgi:CubicO group peptidase (beta-lactamase class C family)